MNKAANDKNTDVEDARTTMPPLASFVQRLALGPGQVALGHLTQAANGDSIISTNYGARELVMAYCSAETPSEAPPPFATHEASDFKTAGWLLIDIGIDEFLDCDELSAKQSSRKAETLSNIANRFASSGARCSSFG